MADAHGGITTVAAPGDPDPGGGAFDTAQIPTMSDGGDVAFSGHRANDVVFHTALDTKEEAVFLYSHGAVSLIAKSGTDIPGVGTIFDLEEGNPFAPGVPPLPAGAPTPLALLYDQGQVAFIATFKDARIGLLLATPKP